jgi:predicted DNA-binding protein (MmcQ/YjbR family)
LQESEVFEMIDHSYDLVFKKLPNKMKSIDI